MKKINKIRVVLLSIATAVVLSSVLSVNAVAAEIVSQNHTNSEQKVYANANINDDFAEDAVLVMFNNEISLQCKAYTVNDFDEINLKNIRNLSSLSESRVAKAKDNIVRSVTQGEQFVFDSGLDMSEFNQVFRLELSETGKNKVLEAIETLEKREDVFYVGPDYIGTYCIDDYDEYQFINTFAENWAYERIKLDEAHYAMRDMNISDSPIRIAVLDSGIDATHPALDYNIVDTNNSDTYGTNCSNGATVDAYGHGTNVAGIIYGVAQNVELISCKLDDYGLPLSSAAYEAIQAVINCETPIQIINLSVRWRINQGLQTGLRYDTILTDALRDYDGLVVCAAGNDSADIDNDAEFDYYPIQHTIPNMVVVGASTQTDGVRSDSNHGAINVDVFAPGDEIYTTNNNHGYSYVGQTSMATPIVTGLAAMLLRVNAELEAEDLVEIIKGTVDTLYSENYVEGVSIIKGAQIQNLYSACSSHGRINAYKAVLMAQDYDTTVPCTHSNHYYTYNSNTHTFRCSNCSYTSSTAHYLYVYDDNGESGVTIKCQVCAYIYTCTDGVAEYSYCDTDNHYATCTCGCYSFLEYHSSIYTQTSSLSTHNAFCAICGTNYLEYHNWRATSNGYQCNICLKTTAIYPGAVQNLSDDELELLLARLTDEELSDLMLALNEADRGRVAALLPEREDDLVTE